MVPGFTKRKRGTGQWSRKASAQTRRRTVSRCGWSWAGRPPGARRPLPSPALCSGSPGPAPGEWRQDHSSGPPAGRTAVEAFVTIPGRCGSPSVAVHPSHVPPLQTSTCSGRLPSAASVGSALPGVPQSLKGGDPNRTGWRGGRQPSTAKTAVSQVWDTPQNAHRMQHGAEPRISQNAGKSRSKSAPVGAERPPSRPWRASSAPWTASRQLPRHLQPQEIPPETCLQAACQDAPQNNDRRIERSQGCGDGTLRDAGC